MPKKKIDTESIMKNASPNAHAIIQAAVHVDAETPAPDPEPAKPHTMPKSPGRPKGKRTEGMNIKLTAEHKEYLRQRSFERSTIKQAVTASDIIGELIEADMKKYYKAKK